MRPSKTLVLAFALAGTILGAGSASAQSPWHYSKALRSGSTIEIRNVIGDVVATPASGSEVEVVARLREGEHGDASDIRIVAVESSDGVTICALYPPRRGSDEPTCKSGGSHNGSSSENNDTRVDFEVRVPRGVRLQAGTVSGDVRATNMTAYVTASSVSGDVLVSTTDLARASSVSGSVDVTMGRADWSGSLSFSTVSGPLTLTFPSELNTELTASSVSGDMDSDWPVQVTRRIAHNSMNGTIGRGGRSLHLSTVSGDITLRHR
jgi:hypothetical protein